MCLRISPPRISPPRVFRSHGTPASRSSGLTAFPAAPIMINAETRNLLHQFQEKSTESFPLVCGRLRLPGALSRPRRAMPLPSPPAPPPTARNGQTAASACLFNLALRQWMPAHRFSASSPSGLRRTGRAGLWQPQLGQCHPPMICRRSGIRTALADALGVHRTTIGRDLAEPWDDHKYLR
jgi:hypothetical protein